LDDAEVAIKTAEQNDLSQPENQDLLLPTNRVRVGGREGFGLVGGR
jgi:type III restriction enzyme